MQQQATARRRNADPTRPLTTAAAVMGWITLVLLLDSDSGIWTQRTLGMLTWLLLAGLLSRENPLVRAQTAVVVVFAAAVEYTFSPLLDVYTYRFHNVPAYVPPGHGLVYLAALMIGRSTVVAAYRRLCVAVALVALGAYSAYGVILADRLDALGAVWFGCYVAFVLWGPSPGLYVGAALVVTYLEVLGTSLGTWVWQLHDPTGLVAIGNPPSGAAGGYGWFDLAALVGAPAVLRGWRRLAIVSGQAGSLSHSGAGNVRLSGGQGPPGQQDRERQSGRSGSSGSSGSSAAPAGE